VFETTLVGNQPKVIEVPGTPNLRLARNQFDRGKITDVQLEEIIQETTRQTLSDQIDAGIHRVTDGRIRWDDPVTPFAAAHDGFEIGGLIRFFDNNVYYRRPTITGPVRFVRSAVAEDFRFAAKTAGRPVLAALCGPFSMAKFCTDTNYNNSHDLYSDCARLVRGELEALVAAGADWVQLDEPFLGFHPEEIGPACDAIATAVRGVKTKVFIYTYFAPVAKVIKRLWDLPVAMIGADCASVPANIEALCDGPSTMGRAFGLIDARNTRLESTDQVVRKLERIADSGADKWPECWITPSAALEFLPYKNAVSKMKRMTESVAAFTGAPVAN